VAYDTSDATARRHREAIARGQGFLARTLAIGAGDCDVQNGLLAALMQAAGVPARLAVGYQGQSGTVLPWLHAWVEYQDQAARWLIADATASLAVAAVPSTSLPALVIPPPSPAQRPALAPPSAPAANPEATAAPPAATSAAAADWRDHPLFRYSPLLLLLPIFPLIATRTRRDVKLDQTVDLVPLLQGALRQPVAFGPLSALFHRPLVPLASGKAVSLMKARALASRGRLFRSLTRPPLARSAQRAGAAVLDDQLPEGKAVGDALGAVDLDGWAAMIESATSDPLLEATNQRLREHGAAWSLRATTRARSAVTAIDLRPLGKRPRGVHGTRLVMIDQHAPWLAEARDRFAAEPQSAIFILLDQVTSRLELPEAQRGKLLGESARAAILEGYGQ
jgi:hypothetical protein